MRDEDIARIIKYAKEFIPQSNTGRPPYDPNHPDKPGTERPHPGYGKRIKASEMSISVPNTYNKAIQIKEGLARLLAADTDHAVREMLTVGTIAPPGDPNVLVLDAEGRLLRQAAVGGRWIEQGAVAPTTDFVRAVCTMPAGTASDGPEVYTVSSQGSTEEPPCGFNGESFRWYFHYGDHSNHVTRLLRRAGNTTATATAEEITWWVDGEMGRRQGVRLRGFPANGIVTALAAGDGGYVLVGWATPDGSADKDSDRPLPANLILVRCQDTSQESATPLWTRPCTLDVDPAPAPEPGDYGTPTPNGDPGAPDAPAEPPVPAALEQRDQTVYTPLSVAVQVLPSDSGRAEPSHLRIAAADYQGWHRWVRSNATRADESRCVRFMPSRPTVRGSIQARPGATRDHDIHVPRVPNSRFAGRTSLGPRGDVIVQLDWCTGAILKRLHRFNLAENTLVIFTSDNGPVVHDGYQDEAVEKLGGHKPSGPLRGGKYSAFEAGTRVPLVVRWPGRVKPGVSEALVCQVDFTASLAALCGRKLAPSDAPDSFNVLPALLGESASGRDHLVEQARALAIRLGPWKYIEPNPGPKVNRNVNIELGNDPSPQLYNLAEDLAESKNLAAQHPEKLEELRALLERIRSDGRSR